MADVPFRDGGRALVDGAEELIMSATTRMVMAAAFAAAMTITGQGAQRVLVYTSIDFPGAVLTNAQGINAGGEVVSSYNDSAPPSKTHGYLLSGGQFQSIDFPGARVTNARGIGPAGDIVGSYQTQTETGGVPAHGFLLSNRGEFSQIDYPRTHQHHRTADPARQYHFGLLP